VCALLVLAMLPEERREHIRRKLEARVLPRELPPGVTEVVSRGDDCACAGCEQPITPDDVQITHVSAKTFLRFHDICDVIWERDRRRCARDVRHVSSSRSWNAARGAAEDVVASLSSRTGLTCTACLARGIHLDEATVTDRLAGVAHYLRVEFAPGTCSLCGTATTVVTLA
jgi:hypothetical protein